MHHDALRYGLSFVFLFLFFVLFTLWEISAQTCVFFSLETFISLFIWVFPFDLVFVFSLPGSPVDVVNLRFLYFSYSLLKLSTPLPSCSKFWDIYLTLSFRSSIAFFILLIMYLISKGSCSWIIFCFHSILLCRENILEGVWSY